MYESSRTDLYDDVVDVTSSSALDVVEIYKSIVMYDASMGLVLLPWFSYPFGDVCLPYSSYPHFARLWSKRIVQE